MVIFSKHLRATDVRYRLAVPTKSLRHFDPIPQGRHSVHFKAMDATGHVWPFRLSIRTAGHLKPVLASKDWLKFVHDKSLKKDDKITFFREQNQANGVRYRIEVQRKIVIFGKQILADV